MAGRRRKALQEVPNMKMIIDDYAPHDKLWTRDDARMDAIKHIIAERLTEPEKRIILLYADCASYADVARLLGVSKAMVVKEVKKIRDKIFCELFKRQHQ